MKLTNIIEDIILEKVMLFPISKDYRISSKYGNRGGKKHHGVDIAVPSETPIIAPLDGVIVSGGKKDTGYHNNACGGTIRMSHPNNITTRYCHVKEIVSTKNGHKFNKGDVIGYTGGGINDPNSGISTGPHLHFEVKVDGKLVDPLKLFNKNKDSTVSDDDFILNLISKLRNKSSKKSTENPNQNNDTSTEKYKIILAMTALNQFEGEYGKYGKEDFKKGNIKITNELAKNITKFKEDYGLESEILLDDETIKFLKNFIDS